MTVDLALQLQAVVIFEELLCTAVSYVRSGSSVSDEWGQISGVQEASVDRADQLSVPRRAGSSLPGSERHQLPLRSRSTLLEWCECDISLSFVSATAPIRIHSTGMMWVWYLSVSYLSHCSDQYPLYWNDVSVISVCVLSQLLLQSGSTLLEWCECDVCLSLISATAPISIHSTGMMWVWYPSVSWVLLSPFIPDI